LSYLHVGKTYAGKNSVQSEFSPCIHSYPWKRMMFPTLTGFSAIDEWQATMTAVFLTTCLSKN